MFDSISRVFAEVLAVFSVLSNMSNDSPVAHVLENVRHVRHWPVFLRNPAPLLAVFCRTKCSTLVRQVFDNYPSASPTFPVGSSASSPVFSMISKTL